MSFAKLKARLRDETGMTLVEVMTSALVLIVVSLGVTKGLDAASNASGSSKLKTTASTLAQQDQERLRTITAANLVKLNTTTTKTVRGVQFTIVSRSRWISDDSGTESCAATGAAGDDEASYMQITSTVTWANMRGMKPVVATSLVAPPNGSFGEQGSLLVEVIDRNGAGVPGISVTASPLSGTGSAITEATGDQGCAFFGFLPPVNYRVTFTKTGYVDTQGVQAVSKDVGVTAAATNRASFQYDKAATLNVNVVTRLISASSDIAAKAEYVTVGHSGLLTPGTRIFGTGTPASAFNATPLFPFASNYGVYSGNCVGANPADNGQTGYFQLAQPGLTTNVTVREVAVRLTNSSSTSTGAIKLVKFTPKSTGCGSSTGSESVTLATGYRTSDPALPFGTYDICVQRDTSSTSKRFSLLTDRSIVNPNGEPVSFSTWRDATCM